MTTTSLLAPELVRYTNGNYLVRILTDGTKIRESEANRLQPSYPESVDCKITNYCDAGCAFCHEHSTKAGVHGDLARYLSVFDGLPCGIEIAIGGGNPLSHPDLMSFLVALKCKGCIPNLTVNAVHLEPYRDLIAELRNKQLIYGLGISYQPGMLAQVQQVVDANTIIHVIAGIHDYATIQQIVEAIPQAKVLVLGYKVFGRGQRLYAKHAAGIEEKIADLYRNVHTLFKTSAVVCFDNLAVKQLTIRRFFTPEKWQQFYMGDDGTFTFYMDLVKGEYAVSSTSSERQAIGDKQIPEMFADIRKERRCS